MIIANYLYRTWANPLFYSFLSLLGCCTIQFNQTAQAADVPAAKPATSATPSATPSSTPSSAPSNTTSNAKLSANPGATITAFSSASSNTTNAQPPTPWRAVGLPKGKAPLTRMEIAVLDGERVLRLATDKSYGTLSHALPDLALGPQATLRWKWRVDQGLPGADMRRKDGDDSPLRVCAMFDLPLDNLGLVERTVMRIARTLTGEALPAATLCYVWDHQLPTGTMLPNPYTRRVRFIVLNSGDSPLGTWVSHERRLAADFLRAFKDDLGNLNDSVAEGNAANPASSNSTRLPPLVAIVVGADSDNTGTASLSYIGDVVLKP